MTKASDNAFPSVLVTEGTEPSAPAAGKQRLYIDSTSHHLSRTDSSGTEVDLETNQAGSIASGTSFPVGPADGDLYYRTDLDLLCRYRSTGTRWVSATLYDDAIGAGTTAVLPLTGTTTGNRVAIPFAGSLGLWLEEFWATFYVAGGGTALGASHKWVCTLVSQPAASTLQTLNIDSGSSAAWRNSGALSIAAASATTEFEWEVTSTKTGTPGNLYILPRIRYRLILT